MSTMKKRIPMFLLALAMMVAMALPTFAASYRPNAQFGYLLNINGSTGSAYQGRALNLMKTDTMGRDQNFIIGTRKGYTGYYMMVTANVNYAVNRSDNGGRAIIWPLSTGSADSRLADNSESVIRLYTSRELLTARAPDGRLEYRLFRWQRHFCLGARPLTFRRNFRFPYDRHSKVSSYGI